MKKILMSVAVIGFVGALAAGATSAYFNDTETSAGNTFTAGTIDLKVNDAVNWSASDPITLDNAKPGDVKTTSLKVENAGSIDGTATLAVAVVHNYENGVADPESDVDTTVLTEEGELCADTNVTVKDGATVLATAPLSTFTTLNLGALAYGKNKTFTVVYEIPGTVDNRIQSDSCVFTLTAALDQAI